MVDIHSHILPGIDDGPKKLEMSLDMIRRSYEEGTKDIVATPHYRRGCFETPYSEVKKVVKYFKDLLKSEGLDINIHYGQEVYYSDRIIEDLEEGFIGTINGGQYMLVEFPMRRIPSEAADYMYELKLRGITPIIAHPERYSEAIKNPGILNPFIEEGCLFQLNAGSIRGFFGKDVKKTAETLIKNNIYSFIGSDAHNNSSRNTGIKEEYQEIFKKNKGLENIFLDNSNKLLANEEIQFKGKMIKKKKGFFFR
ncbi:tyrosine-protein phosphatase [Clostridium sardiniense]|uniref:tyrosine-protein phosphatase n=1 Tax=Clostridium sardiniense TaxID=29369 RepID=UPI001957E70C|nr:CpsB/CapC family capsule biosynthesis tyrosine phosphatase [Clostridium sardiniense]MBM7833057.1 protein-tyrosine phosphatase [Clostridium sardiniense]